MGVLLGVCTRLTQLPSLVITCLRTTSNPARGAIHRSPRTSEDIQGRPIASSNL